MWHLERELRATGNPLDIRRANIISSMRKNRGEDIPLPKADTEMYLVPPKEGNLLTKELAIATKDAVANCADEVLLEVMRYPRVEKRVYWQKSLPEAPDLWLEFILSRSTLERRFIGQALHFANIHINTERTTPYTTDPALLNANLGHLREAFLNGQLAGMEQNQSRVLLEYVFQDYSPQT